MKQYSILVVQMFRHHHHRLREIQPLALGLMPMILALVVLL
jgi:hypothetical protein